MFERFQKVEVKIKDYTFLSSIPLDKVRKFLSDNQWNETIIHDNFSIWEKEDGWTLNLPKEQHYKDYPKRLSEGLEILEESEEKNQLVIIEEIFKK